MLLSFCLKVYAFGFQLLDGCYAKGKILGAVKWVIDDYVCHEYRGQFVLKLEPIHCFVACTFHGENHCLGPSRT
ncbi:Uncharacterized protein TCM_042473 [Theobroma cacao]|uniref:Secreted protein n=1 Tax=Theobroma cacao TaxID=3641 RepID=A0A061FM44_THECC|nr:Uncharacterized protein TCM_042473 [Theobroma cacao]